MIDMDRHIQGQSCSSHYGLVLVYATEREHFAYKDRTVSQIFILLISNGRKILSNVNVVAQG